MKKQIIVLLILIIALSGFLFFNLSNETWGLNKTVGWAWDLTNIIWWIGLLLILLLLILIVVLSYNFLKFIFKQIDKKKN